VRFARDVIRYEEDYTACVYSTSRLYSLGATSGRGNKSLGGLNFRQFGPLSDITGSGLWLAGVGG